MTKLKGAELRAGVKQSRKAIENGEAAKVYVADDADPHVTESVVELCKSKAVDYEWAESMEKLGKAAGINVGAAVVTVLK